LLTQARDALEHKFIAVTNGLDLLADTHRVAQAAEQMLGTLAQIRPASTAASSGALLREQQMLSRIARKFHLPEEQLRARLLTLRNEARGRGANRSEPNRFGGEDSDGALPDLGSTISAWERDFLELVLLDASFLPRIESEIGPADIASDIARTIYETCRRLFAEDERLDFGRLLAEFDDPGVKNLLVDLDESSTLKSSADHERWWQDVLAAAVRRRDEQRRRRSLAEAQQNPLEAERMLDQFFQQSRFKTLGDYERRKG
jgi:hypothetical protein